MPRYFFDFTDGERVYADREGTELSDLRSIEEEALKTGEALAKDLEAAGVDCSRWSVDVVDVSRSLVISVRLARHHHRV